MAEQQKKSGGAKKYGRSEEKCKKYRANKTREKNKLKRILQSNGLQAAEAYADKVELYGYLRKLLGQSIMAPMVLGGWLVCKTSEQAGSNPPGALTKDSTVGSAIG